MNRINLIPPELGARLNARRQARTLGIVFGGLVVVIALGWLAMTLQLNHQKNREAEAATKAASIKVKVNALQEFGLMEKTIQQKRSTLSLAMTDDIGWSKLLQDVSKVIPDNSWLTAFNGTAQPVAVAPVAPSTPGAAPASAPPSGSAAQPPVTPVPAGPAKLGTLTFTAVTFDFPGVAKWLTTLEQQLPTVQNIFVPAAVKAKIGDREVVNYTSTADLSAASRSARYQNQGQK
ncbi:MAG: PilN domain-containing protein [Actinomycetota bacterium]